MLVTTISFLIVFGILVATVTLIKKKKDPKSFTSSENIEESDEDLGTEYVPKFVLSIGDLEGSSEGDLAESLIRYVAENGRDENALLIEQYLLENFPDKTNVITLPVEKKKPVFTLIEGGKQDEPPAPESA